MGEGSDYLFYCLFSENIFLFGWELGDGSVGAGARGWEQFILMIYFQTMFLCYDSKPLNFSLWHGNVSQGNN